MTLLRPSRSSVTLLQTRPPAYGIDTFAFDGDSIRVQTVRYTLEKTG